MSPPAASALAEDIADDVLRCNARLSVSSGSVPYRRETSKVDLATELRNFATP